MLLETKLLSKVLLEKDFYIMSKFNVTLDDFSAVENKATYQYIKQFIKEYGYVPEASTVVEAVPDFQFHAEVLDTFVYLCKSLKKNNAKKKIFNVLQNQASKNFGEMQVDDFINWLGSEVDAVKTVMNTATSTGSNFATNGMDRLKRYQEVKAAGSGLFIRTPYESLNEALDGGMEKGDYVLLQAFSNVGKSWVASDMGVFAWGQEKEGVLHYSPELSKSQQENRNDTLVGHFNNVHLRNGELGDSEKRYAEYLKGFTDNDTPYIIKTMEDLPDGLTLDVIEADLQINDNIGMVIIDGFNLMRHGHGKLDRGAMTQTSRQLRQLFSRYNVVGLVVHQVNANEQKENKKKAEKDMSPVPRPASILGYSETIAVVQDAATILSFDAVDGNGQILVAKCRGTGKDKTIDLNLNFNYGYIKEASPVDYF